MARITPDVPQRGGARNLLNVVDNYYRPARDRMGEAAFSQGLNAASNIANTMARKGIEEDINEAKIKAQADAEAGEGPDAELKEVRLGNLFRPHSKAYNQVYAEAMGRKAAIEFNENMALEYEKSGLKYNTDPEAYRKWRDGKTQEFLKSPSNQNPYFMSGALPTMRQATVNMSAAHMSNVSRQMERNHIASIQKQAANFVMGISTGETTPAEVITKLGGLNNEGFGTGLAGPTTRKALISSYLSVADAMDNKEMLTELLEAQSKGTLRLTPDEWNNVTKQIMAIERDIEFRVAQKERAEVRQEKKDTDFLADVVTDFYIDPENAAVTFPEFLQAPAGDTGKTMAEVIAASPNSAALMAKAKTSYETMNSLFEISPEQQAMNNVNIADAYTNGEINNANDLQQWMAAQRSDGTRFNEKNIEFAYGELQKARDPDSPYNTQAHKDYASATQTRIIQTFEGAETGFSVLGGEFVGGMTSDIKLRFRENLELEYAALPDGRVANSQAIREAVERAEKATMDYYRTVAPDAFEAARQRYQQALDANEISITSNPAMFAETQRLIAEQQAIDDEEMRVYREKSIANSIDKRFDRSDIEIQQGIDVLRGGEGQPEDTPIPEPRYEGSMTDYDQQLLIKTLSELDAGNAPYAVRTTIKAFEERYGKGSATKILKRLGLDRPFSELKPELQEQIDAALDEYGDPVEDWIRNNTQEQ